MKGSSLAVVVAGAILAATAVVCELLSIAAFYGFGAELWPVCGSACEVWPGIPTGGACILICVVRNGAYVPLFYAGFAAGCTAPALFIRGLVSGRQTPPPDR